MNISNFFNKPNPKSSNLLSWIICDLQEVITYTKENIIEEKDTSAGLNLEKEEESKNGEDSFISRVTKKKIEIIKRQPQPKINLGIKRKIEKSLGLSKKEEENLGRMLDIFQEKEFPLLKSNKEKIKHIKQKYHNYGSEIIKRLEKAVDLINYINEENKTKAELNSENISLLNQ